MFCSRSFLIAVWIFCSSRLPLPVEPIKLRECVAMFWISDLWSAIFTVFWTFLNLCFSCRDDFLVLHGFLVEVNLWDSRDLFVKIQLVLPLLNIWDWLADWMDCCCTSASLIGWVAAPLLCTVYFPSYLTFVSVAVLWFALPAVGCAPLLPAVGLALLPAVCFALLLAAVGFADLGSFHRFSPSRRLSAALRAHRRFDVLLAVLVPVLLYFVLLFTTDSLAVVPSLILSRDTLW